MKKEPVALTKHFCKPAQAHITHLGFSTFPFCFLNEYGDYQRTRSTYATLEEEIFTVTIVDVLILSSHNEEKQSHNKRQTRVIDTTVATSIFSTSENFSISASVPNKSDKTMIRPKAKKNH